MIKEFNKDVSSVNQSYQPRINKMIQDYERSHPKLMMQSQVDRDVTNSSKWPVAEKVAKASFTSPLPSHLECEICLDVLDDPVMTICCGQSYCKECVGKVHNKVCPHCRGKIETFPDKKSVRLINELKICCPYHIDDKCQWKGAPSELLNHLKVCDIKPIMCPHGCDKQLEKNNMRLHAEFDCSLRLVSCIHCWKKVKDKDMAKHTSGCPKMPLPCPNKCSAPKMITREEMKQHLEVCPDQVVACKYSELGCQQKMKRKELDQHMSTAIQHHLDLVAKRAISEENARKQLEYANKQLEKKVASLEVMMTKLMNK
ncbi:TNF receptor-associated factor 5-like [Dysidea avara]|uniref:TNF receptor-associated factor 5-like n=1 Tax=Dysidea avara TaxID=196820 RepID=UPI003322E29F